MHHETVNALTYVALAVSSIGAVAAAFAAWQSWRSVRLSHRPAVWSHLKWDFLGTPAGYHVQVHNDGTGVALRVRLRTRDADGTMSATSDPPIASVRPGEAVPATLAKDGTSGMLLPLPAGAQNADDIRPVIRYEDLAGAHWELDGKHFRRLGGRRHLPDW